MTYSIRAFVTLGGLGMLLLLAAAWTVADVTTANLRAHYIHTVNAVDALAGDVVLHDKLMDDEETGLRGYLLTGAPIFLQPWQRGHGALPPVRARIAALADDTDTRALIALLLQRGRAWERWAAPLIASRTTPTRPALVVRRQLEGKHLFDSYRAASARLLHHLNGDRQRDLADSMVALSALTHVFDVVFAAAALVILFVGWRTLRAIEQPVERLAAEAIAIGRGNLEQPITAAAVREFMALAQSMEVMRRRLAGQRALAETVSSTLHLDDVYAEFGRLVGDLIPFDRLSIILIDDDQRAATLAYATGEGTDAFPSGRAFPVVERVRAHVYAQGSPLVHDDMTLLPDGDLSESERHLRASGIRSAAIIPLPFKGRVIGTLNLCSRHIRAYTGETIEPLIALAPLIASAIENGRSHAREEHLARLAAASEARLRAIYQTMACGVAVIDAQGQVLEANDTAQEALGLTLEETQKRFAPDSQAPVLVREDGSDLPLQERPSMLAIQNGCPQRGAVLGLVRPDGERRWIQVDAIPVPDDAGRAHQAVVSLTDVTERRRAQAALEESHRALERSNADLQQFAYVASHDLQEPLRTISSYLQLLKRRYAGKVLDDGANEFIGYAVDGAKRMQALIQALLSYSRIGSAAVSFAPVDCEHVVATAIRNLQGTIDGTGARITCDPLPVVQGDAVQLGQLFQNLIGNALKFCRDRAPEIHIWARREGTHWHINVRDNGIGLDPGQAERIFVIFQRLHTRDEYEGTGIGLSICKKIAERHGGTIRVASRPGEGSTFTVALPAGAPADKAA